jgi:hypothetical protein
MIQGTGLRGTRASIGSIPEVTHKNFVDLNGKLGTEDNPKLQIRNDYGLRVVNFSTSKN